MAKLNVDNDTDKIKSALKAAIDIVASKAKGEGSVPVDPNTASTELRESKNKLDSSVGSNQESKAKKDYQGKQLTISKKMDSARTKQTLSITKNIITQFSGFSISIDPFAKCCPKDTFSIGFPFPPLVDLAIGQGVDLVKSKIDGMTASDLKGIFGGKSNVTPKDIRLGLLNISQISIPDSLSIPKPELNLQAGTDMFSGLLGGLSMPQASFPSPLNSQQLSKKVTVDLSIVKPVIKSGLEQYLQDNLLIKNSQNLETDFIYTNANDIKSFMKKFIDSMSDKISDKLTGYYNKINASNIKNANGTDLNVLENTVFNFPPFGPVAKSLFIAKGKLNFAKKKSNAQFIISEDALKIASGVLKTALTPIVNNPVAGLLVAAAGATKRTDLIRKIHPILDADDIPPWERMTLKNVLFLLFLDEFNSTAADQVGFFRSYL